MGRLVDALRASIAIPGIFTPVMIDGRYLVDGGLVNEIPVSLCRVMGAEYVIAVNVLPEPHKMNCNPKNGRNYPACELLRLGEIVDRSETTVSSEPSPSLQSHFNAIQNGIKMLLQDHQPWKQMKTLKSLEPVRMDKAKRLQSKAPSLIDVLTQSLTIAEYRVAMENLKNADMVISPEVEDINFWQFTKLAQAIEAGEKAARYILQNSKLTSVLSKS